MISPVDSARAMNSPGGTETPLGVVPADEGLHRGERPIGQVHARLVVEGELGPVDRAAQVGAHLQALVGGLVHRRDEDPVLALATALGLVHREVGGAQHVGGAAQPGPAVGDADAAAHPQRALGQAERPIERLQDARRDRRRLALVHVDQEQRELVAAEAGRRVLRPDRRGQALPYLGDEQVALGMPERVVHVLEVVEVDEQDRGALRDSPAPSEGVLEAVDVQGTVRQAGQRVVERLAGQLRLELHPLRDVVDGEGRVPGDRTVDRARGDHLDRHPLPVAMADPPGAAVRVALLRADDREDVGSIVGMGERVQAEPDEVLGAIAEDGRGRLGRVEHDRRAIEDERRLGDRLQGRADRVVAAPAGVPQDPPARHPREPADHDEQRCDQPEQRVHGGTAVELDEHGKDQEACQGRQHHLGSTQRRDTEDPPWGGGCRMVRRGGTLRGAGS